MRLTLEPDSSGLRGPRADTSSELAGGADALGSGTTLGESWVVLDAQKPFSKKILSDLSATEIAYIFLMH